MKVSKSILTVLVLFITAGALIAFSNPDKKEKEDVSGVLVEIIDDTCSNSMNKTGYLEFEPGRIVDSVQFIQYAKGEIDVDRFIGTKALIFEDTPGHLVKKNYSTLAGDTTTLTTDLAAGASSNTWIVTWAGSKLTGANGVYCQIDAASSGNDATDPNNLRLYGKVFYRPQ